MRLLTRANMNGPSKDAFDRSSRKPMGRHFVLGFPRALLCLSQEKSCGVEIRAGTRTRSAEMQFAMQSDHTTRASSKCGKNKKHRLVCLLRPLTEQTHGSMESICLEYKAFFIVEYTLS